MISDLRNPGQLDGSLARILNKKAQILEDDPARVSAEEAEVLRMRANVARRELLAREGGLADDSVPAIGHYYMVDKAFDRLVPAFFR